ELADLLGQLIARPADAQLDVEMLPEQIHARVADLLGHQHARPAPAVATHTSRSSSQSIQAVSARTSSGSVAGNMAIRSWLRPSLRYGSTSTIPLARRAAASAAPSTCSPKSIVPTTNERLAGSDT